MKMKLNERYESSYSFLEESFSALRTNLRFAKDAEDIRIIAVTSPEKTKEKLLLPMDSRKVWRKTVRQCF